MWYVQSFFNNKFETVACFPTYDKALYFVKYSHVVHNVALSKMQIVHKGLVLTLNENSLKKVFK